jgi:hypothetical protein
MLQGGRFGEEKKEAGIAAYIYSFVQCDCGA